MPRSSRSFRLLPLDRGQEAVGVGPVVDVAGPQVVSTDTKCDQGENPVSHVQATAFVSKKKRPQ